MTEGINLKLKCSVCFSSRNPPKTNCPNCDGLPSIQFDCSRTAISYSGTFICANIRKQSSHYKILLSESFSCLPFQDEIVPSLITVAQTLTFHLPTSSRLQRAGRISSIPVGVSSHLKPFPVILFPSRTTSRRMPEHH